ncbi:MAG TPA: phosphoribosylformylglycinamidine cyclo-ligase [Candidatus Tumulicola sp.]|nr:phosphoribosylformylglycinamidine cyclo-ligase [Candidatus Tumulicola sp.]
MSDAYAGAGVSIDAGNEAVTRYRSLLERNRDPRILEGIGGFGGAFEFRGYRDPVLVASTDGVGTKVLVAAELRRFDGVGRDLVQHCINDILCANAQPLFFLDYLAVGKLDPDMAEAVVSGIAAACSENGVALLGGETAEMPGVYTPSHFDLAGTIVGAVERDAMIDVSRVVAGDAIVGLPANGFHTNGYSLVRRAIARERWDSPLGKKPRTIADALLAVHPSYLPHVRAVQAVGVSIKAMAHITGGGLLDNVPRVLLEGLAARFVPARWPIPEIERFVVAEARLERDDAYRTFNMGIGFCMIVSAGDAQKAVRAADAALREKPIPDLEDARAFIAGEIEPRHAGGPSVVLA